MRLRKNVKIHRSPAVWSAAACALCTGVSQYLDVFTSVIPETPLWRAGFFALGVLFAVLAAAAPGILESEA